MATLNDFKLLNLKCKKYFGLLEKELNRDLILPSEKHKERFGFYLLMIESICDIKDISDIINIITDQEFNSTVFNQRDEDFGIDAIYIDEDENYINLFNFKFRNEFNEDKKQSINESFLSTKYTNSIVAANTTGLTGKLENFTSDIIQKLGSNDIWKLRLYVVSNENKELDINSPEITILKDLYGLETITYGLNTISNLMSVKPKPINAILHLNKESVLPFVENSLSSSKSYIISISASDLIRITCNNESYRENYKMEDFQVLSDTNMEFDLLFDNVRGLIIRSKFNENIFNTLKSEPSKFFMYNNGLTITASDVISEETNANKKLKITIKDFQVVNGGQTLRTIHRFNEVDKGNIIKYLSDCELLLRVFKTDPNSDIKNKIAEYTNSQNAISYVDLKSLSKEQILIEQFLDERNIIYARKVGDTGKVPTKNYIHKISMEKFGQILFSINGSPEKASNQKRQIFDKFYDRVFGEKNFDMNRCAEYVINYFEIKYAYDSNLKGYSSTDQKIFFIMYINEKLTIGIDEKIDFFEKIIESYNTLNGNLERVRVLIQIKFKEYLDEEIKKYLNNNI